MNKIIKKILCNLYITFIFLLLYVPIFLLVLFSFNSSISRTTWTKFTLKWYKLLFFDSEVIKATINTLIVAFFAGIISTTLGLLCCIGVLNSDKKNYKIIKFLTNIPIVNPEIVTGISLMLFFIFLQKIIPFIEPGILTLILTHSTFCLPYAFLVLFPKFKKITPQNFEAACDLGLTPLKAFFVVIFPEIFSSIVASMLLVFGISIDDFIISYFTCGNTQTLSTLIYSMVRKSIVPEINALSSVMLSLIFFTLIISNIKINKKQKNKFFIQPK